MIEYGGRKGGLEHHRSYYVVLQVLVKRLVAGAGGVGCSWFGWVLKVVS